MDQEKYREQHYKRTEEVIKLNSLMLRSLLSLLIVVLIGRGTAIATATTNNRATLVILGLFVSMILFFAVIGLYLAIRNEINSDMESLIIKILVGANVVGFLTFIGTVLYTSWKDSKADY